MLAWASEHLGLRSREHILVGNTAELSQGAVLTRTSFSDKKCPFTGMVSIRGRILTGTVVSTKMHRTLIVRREYLHFIPKYARYEKRHANLAAHVSPAFRVEDGDTVTVGQCRPLSKTVSDTATEYLQLVRDTKAYVLITWSAGSFQRVAGATKDGTAIEAVQQVLNVEGLPGDWSNVASGLLLPWKGGVICRINRTLCQVVNAFRRDRDHKE
jgi:ribosomal protein uS17